jgi:hypothetical protein
LRPIYTGAPMSRDPLTLTSRFEKYLAKQDLSDRTVKGYLDDLRFFTQWYEEIQNKKIDWPKVSDFDLQTFRQYLGCNYIFAPFLYQSHLFNQPFFYLIF